MLIDNKSSRIVNAKPITVHPHGGSIDDETLDQLPKDKIIIVRCWIDKFLFTDPYDPEIKSSYHLKHILERDTGIYLTNNQFKDAMLICGYGPIDANELNWCYCIHKDSHILNSGLNGFRNIIDQDIKRYLTRFPELA